MNKSTLFSLLLCMIFTSCHPAINEPAEEKTYLLSDSEIMLTYASMKNQGRKRKWLDRETTKSKYCEDYADYLPNFLDDDNSIAFAIYDGHRGPESAKYLAGDTEADSLLKIIQTDFLEKNENDEQFRTALEILTRPKPRRFHWNEKEWENSKKYIEELIALCFCQAELKLKAHLETHSDSSGSTAVVVMIIGKLIITAHVGDSFVVTLDKDSNSTIITTPIHNVNSQNFDSFTIDRLAREGNITIDDSFLNNGYWKLQTTRSFGDWNLKEILTSYCLQNAGTNIAEIDRDNLFEAVWPNAPERILTAYPSVNIAHLTRESRLIISSDGIEISGGFYNEDKDEIDNLFASTRSESAAQTCQFLCHFDDAYYSGVNEFKTDDRAVFVIDVSESAE